MPSTKRIESLDTFFDDVAITPADSEAQWRIRIGRRMSTRDYLAWCGWVTRDAVTPARDFHTKRFEL